MTDVFGSLAAIRAELADMLGQVDTAELPAPDLVRVGGRGKTGSELDRSPGASWEPAHTIKVFTIDTPEGVGAVYVSDVRWGIYTDPSDWEAFKVEDARRLGMALLAAADWAEKHRPEPPRIGNVRPMRATTGVAPSVA